MSDKFTTGSHPLNEKNGGTLPQVVIYAKIRERLQNTKIIPFQGEKSTFFIIFSSLMQGFQHLRISLSE